MSPGAKVFLTLGAVAGVFTLIAVASTKKASAAPGALPKTQPPGSNQPPDVIVPEPGQPAAQVPPLQVPPLAQPSGGTPAPTVPGTNIPLPPLSAPPASTPPGSSGNTITLPNPLGGPPLGTFNPATGNVFGPDGTVIGTFNPATGAFTAANGVSFQVPGFGVAPPVVPASSPPSAGPVPSAPPGVTVQLPTGPVVIPLPPVAAQPTSATAPVTTVTADTAAMVAALLDAESRPGWNTSDPNVSAWQQARPPLKVDGQFGTKTALTVAPQLGTLPLIRQWPAGSQKKAALQAYQTALITLANRTADPALAAQLRHSASREQAQSFGVEGRAPAIPSESLISLTKVA